jgi:hypothetical protein
MSCFVHVSKTDEIKIYINHSEKRPGKNNINDLIFVKDPVSNSAHLFSA